MRRGGILACLLALACPAAAMPTRGDAREAELARVPVDAHAPPRSARGTRQHVFELLERMDSDDEVRQTGAAAIPATAGRVGTRIATTLRVHALQPEALPPFVKKPPLPTRDHDTPARPLKERIKERKDRKTWFKRHYLPAAFARREFVFDSECRTAVFGPESMADQIVRFGPFTKNKYKTKRRTISVLRAGHPLAGVLDGRPMFGPPEVVLAYYAPSGKGDHTKPTGVVRISAGTRPPTLERDSKGTYIFTIYGEQLRGAKERDARLPIENFLFTALPDTPLAEELVLLASRLIPFVRALNSRKYRRIKGKKKSADVYADATGGDSSAALEKLCQHFTDNPGQARGWIVPRSKTPRVGEMSLGGTMSVGVPDISGKAGRMGKGASGRVYLAWILSETPESKVALKIDSHYPQSQSLRANFRTEASNSFALSYPGFGYRTNGSDGTTLELEVPGADRVARTLGYFEDGKERGMLVKELVHGDLKRLIFNTAEVPIAL